MYDLSWLTSRFAEHPSRTFIVWSGRTYSYEWLIGRLEHWRAALARDLADGCLVVALEGDYSPEVIAALLVLLERGDVIVPLTASVERQKDEFLAIAEAQARLIFEGEACRVVRTGRRPANPLTVGLLAQGHPGLVLFSSGSTGKSKAALHDFSPLLEKFKVRRHAFVSLTFLLLDHIGGINTLLYVLSNAGTVVSVQIRDPDVVCRAIQDHRVELLPTSPTFLNLLLISEAYRRYDLSSLRRITYGTEVMPERTLRRIHEVFPNVELQQTYGLSELGIMRTKSRSSESLWVKVGGEGFETRVVDGVLHIRARSAMLGYLNHASPYDAQGWFNTGDRVEVDGDYVRLLGRDSEIVNVGGMKVHPGEVESALLDLSNVKDVAVSGEPNPITGNVVVATFTLVQPEEPAAFRARVRAFCKGRLEPYKSPAKILIAQSDQHTERFKKMRNRPQ